MFPASAASCKSEGKRVKRNTQQGRAFFLSAGRQNASKRTNIAGTYSEQDISPSYLPIPEIALPPFVAVHCVILSPALPKRPSRSLSAGESESSLRVLGLEPKSDRIARPESGLGLLGIRRGGEGRGVASGVVKSRPLGQGLLYLSPALVAITASFGVFEISRACTSVLG